MNPIENQTPNNTIVFYEKALIEWMDDHSPEAEEKVEELCRILHSLADNQFANFDFWNIN